MSTAENEEIDELEAAAANGDADAMHELGYIYDNGEGVPRDYGKALIWYKKAASAGSAYSMVNLGLMYDQGTGVRQDYAEARRWYEKAAANDDGLGMHYLGLLYLHGRGVWRSYRKARQWIEKAANRNEPAAICQLGKLYRDGLGGAQDYRKAHALFEKAADLGVEEAMYDLGLLYYYGHGVARDVAKTHAWFDKARGNDNQKPDTSGPAAVRGSIDEARLAHQMAKLNALIGLSAVKAEINRLVNVALVNQKRVAHALKPIDFSMHLVFSGRPGTGKTTVAQMIGDIYAALGLLPKGHLVKADKGSLQGKWLGHTPGKTHAVINKAKGGVLFLDEAYSLISANKGDVYADEFTAILIERMENERGKFAVIAAGYPGKIETFLKANEGFKSRFKTIIHFEDYNAAELTEIFCQLAKAYEFTLTGGARKRVATLCQDLRAAADETFGNAREVRNLFEDVVKDRYAARIAAGNTNLSQLIADDIPEGIINRSPHPPASRRAPTPIGIDKPPPGAGS